MANSKVRLVESKVQLDDWLVYHVPASAVGHVHELLAPVATVQEGMV